MHEDLAGLRALMAGVAPSGGGKDGKLLDGTRGLLVPNPVLAEGAAETDELRVCISLVGLGERSKPKAEAASETKSSKPSLSAFG